MSQEAVQRWQRQSCCSSTSGTATTIGPHLHPYSRQPALWPDTMTVLAAAARGSPEGGRPTWRCCWRGAAAVLARGRDAGRRRWQHPMLGFDGTGKRLGRVFLFLLKRFFHLSVADKGN
jgi:hypothetical protein